MTTIGPIQSYIELIQPFPLSDDAVHMQFGHNILIGQLTLEIYYFKMWMDDENDNHVRKTPDHGHTKALLEPSDYMSL